MLRAHLNAASTASFTFVSATRARSQEKYEPALRDGKRGTSNLGLVCSRRVEAQVAHALGAQRDRSAAGAAWRQGEGQHARACSRVPERTCSAAVTDVLDWPHGSVVNAARETFCHLWWSDVVDSVVSWRALPLAGLSLWLDAALPFVLSPDCACFRVIACLLFGSGTRFAS